MRTKLIRSLSAIILVFWVALMTVLPAQAATLAASDDDGSADPRSLVLVLLAAGPAVYGGIRLYYRNTNARHRYESETEVKIDNLRQVDDLEDHRRRTRDSKLPGANSHQLHGNPAAGSLGAMDNALSKVIGTIGGGGGKVPPGIIGP